MRNIIIGYRGLSSTSGVIFIKISGKVQFFFLCLQSQEGTAVGVRQPEGCPILNQFLRIGQGIGQELDRVKSL